MKDKKDAVCNWKEKIANISMAIWLKDETQMKLLKGKTVYYK